MIALNRRESLAVAGLFSFLFALALLALAILSSCGGSSCAPHSAPTPGYPAEVCFCDCGYELAGDGGCVPAVDGGISADAPCHHGGTQ